MQPAAAGASVAHVRTRYVHYRLCNASAANGRLLLLTAAVSSRYVAFVLLRFCT